MSNSKSRQPKPVTQEEMNMVREILARMNSQGTTDGAISSSAVASLMSSQPNQMLAAMTDASKRQRDDEVVMNSGDGSSFSDYEGTDEADFSVVSTPAPNRETPQLPIAPKKSAPEAPIELPKGISSLKEWGYTVCELQKVKHTAHMSSGLCSMGRARAQSVMTSATISFLASL